jgi:hypothetical protein
VKYLDGKLATFQSAEDRNVELLRDKEARNKGLLEAASYIQGIDTSPLGSKEAAYQKATAGNGKDAYEDLFNVMDESIVIEEAVEDLEAGKLLAHMQYKVAAAKKREETWKSSKRDHAAGRTELRGLKSNCLEASATADHPLVHSWQNTFVLHQVCRLFTHTRILTSTFTISDASLVSW